MYKKLIAMIMVFAMLVSISPAVAAENAPAKPTAEEILNEYHQKSFAAQNSQEVSAVSANSRGASGSGQTLEQEAVGQLTEAGYEAYNVTAENYLALESSLMCDFSELGLDPDGSYIIVISGEDENNNEPNPNSRAFDGPTQDLFDPGGGSDFFTYYYQNKTYAMRYVTVTPTENSHLSMIADSVELLEGFENDEKLDALNLVLSVLSLSPSYSTTATILSLLMTFLPTADIAQPESLTYKAVARWTTTYTQVFCPDREEWIMSTCVEYVTPKYFLDYYYNDIYTEDVERIEEQIFLPIIYSEHYNDTEYMKQIAAYAFEHNAHPLDTVEEIVYQYNGRTVSTIQRWTEYPSYEPA